MYVIILKSCFYFRLDDGTGTIACKHASNNEMVKLLKEEYVWDAEYLKNLNCDIVSGSQSPLSRRDLEKEDAFGDVGKAEDDKILEEGDAFDEFGNMRDTSVKMNVTEETAERGRKTTGISPEELAEIMETMT